MTRNKQRILLGFTWYENLVEQIISWSQRGVNKIDTTVTELRCSQNSMIFLPKNQKIWILNHFWRSEEHAFYETLLGKWIFQLRWVFSQVRTMSVSGCMGFCRFCPNFPHNPPYFLWEHIKQSTGKPET